MKACRCSPRRSSALRALGEGQKGGFYEDVDWELSPGEERCTKLTDSNIIQFPLIDQTIRLSVPAIYYR